MKYKVKLPFTEIVFTDANKKHVNYFKKLLFDGDFSYPKNKYVLKVKFESINLNEEYKKYLEEDTVAANGKLYISDTKGNKVELDFCSFNKKNLKVVVEPDFDLYFLYSYILEPLIIIWAAEHGITYVHSSALCLNNKANIFAAWRHTGKTSSIFSLAKENVEFMADDFCVLSESKAYIYPKSINIFSYNFESYPWLYEKLPRGEAVRIKLSVYVKKILYSISQVFRGPLSKVFFRLSELAEVSTNTKVTPKQLDLKVCPNALYSEVVFITKADGETQLGEKLSRETIRHKMLSIIKYEINDFFKTYQKFKYLYPEMDCKIVENFDEKYLDSVGKNVKKAIEKTIKKLPSKDAYLKDVS